MPFTCCVPYCKGNYNTGPKVSVYSFPKCEDLKRKWLNAIRKKDLVVTAHTKVCELHFLETDLETEAWAFDEKTGRTLTAPLKFKRRKKDAVPSIFEGYPSSCRPRPVVSRLSPNLKKMMRENERLKMAIEESVADAAAYTQLRQISSMKDLEQCVERFGVDSFYKVSDQSEDFCVFHLEVQPYPQISHSAVVSNLNVSVYLRKHALKKIAKFTFPYKLNNFNEFTDILETLKSMNSVLEEKESSKIHIVNDALSSFKTDENESMINFVREQIELGRCAKNKKYSNDTIVFATFLHSISPRAYNFIRSSDNIILPHPSTLKRIIQEQPLLLTEDMIQFENE